VTALYGAAYQSLYLSLLFIRKVELDVGAGNRKGRNTSKPIRRWVRPTSESDIGWGRKDVKVSITGGVTDVPEI
jgi:hypothetical protein